MNVIAAGIANLKDPLLANGLRNKACVALECGLPEMSHADRQCPLSQSAAKALKSFLAHLINCDAEECSTNGFEMTLGTCTHNTHWSHYCFIVYTITGHVWSLCVECNHCYCYFCWYIHTNTEQSPPHNALLVCHCNRWRKARRITSQR